MKKFPQRTIAILLILAIVLPLESAFAARAASPERQSEKARREEILRSLEYNRYFFERKRDPVFAGILSWYVPGLGQYYSGEIWKGTAFLVSEYTLTLCAIFYFLNFDFNAGGGTGFKISVDAKRTDLGVVETSRRNIFLGMLAGVFVLHLYNVSDAVQSARSFNIELEEKRQKLKKDYPFLYTAEDLEGKRSVYIGFQKML